MEAAPLLNPNNKEKFVPALILKGINSIEIQDQTHKLTEFPIDYLEGKPIPSEGFIKEFGEILNLTKLYPGAKEEIINGLLEVAIELELAKHSGAKYINEQLSAPPFNNIEAKAHLDFINGLVNLTKLADPITKEFLANLGKAAMENDRKLAAYYLAKLLVETGDSLGALGFFQKSGREGYIEGSNEYKSLLQKTKQSNSELFVFDAQEALQSNDTDELIEYGNAYFNEVSASGAKLKREGCLPFYKRGVELGNVYCIMQLEAYYKFKSHTINLDTIKNQKKAADYFSMALDIANAGNVEAQCLIIRKISKGNENEISLCQKVFSGRINELAKTEFYQTINILVKAAKKEYGFAALALARMCMHKLEPDSKSVDAEQAAIYYELAIKYRAVSAQAEFDKIKSDQKSPAR